MVPSGLGIGIHTYRLVCNVLACLALATGPSDYAPVRAPTRPNHVTHGNASGTLYDHDDLGRTLDVWHKTSGGTTLGRYQYEYDNASNVTKRTDNDGSVTNFG